MGDAPYCAQRKRSGATIIFAHTNIQIPQLSHVHLNVLVVVVVLGRNTRAHTLPNTIHA